MAEKTKMITSIGGQALMEGIMMRGPKVTAVGVRKPDKTIDVSERPTENLKDKYPILGWPIIRGTAAMIDSMKIGFSALNESAEKSVEGLEEEEPSRFEKWLDRVFGEKIMNVIMGIAMVLGMALAILLFFVLPTWLVNLMKMGVGEGLEGWRSIIEGVMRIAIFIGYVALCGLQPDLRRTFQYHGAEHKTIFCYENEEELTVENVRHHSRFHQRCGTSFMIIMLLLGVIIGFFIPFTNPILRTLVKLLCIPVVVGIGYELIRICGRYDNLATRIISAPGLWMQRLTVKEPDDSMIEVAIEAMKAVIPEDGTDLQCPLQAKQPKEKTA